jgi:hypothetical protein
MISGWLQKEKTILQENGLIMIRGIEQIIVS